MASPATATTVRYEVVPMGRHFGVRRLGKRGTYKIIAVYQDSVVAREVAQLLDCHADIELS